MSAPPQRADGGAGQTDNPLNPIRAQLGRDGSWRARGRAAPCTHSWARWEPGRGAAGRGARFGADRVPRSCAVAAAPAEGCAPPPAPASFTPSCTSWSLPCAASCCPAPRLRLSGRRCHSRGCCASTCPATRTVRSSWAPRPSIGSASAPPASTWRKPPCSSMCAPVLTAALSSTTGAGWDGAEGWGCSGGCQVTQSCVSLMLAALQVLVPEAAGAGGALRRQLLPP